MGFCAKEVFSAKSPRFPTTYMIAKWKEGRQGFQVRFWHTTMEPGMVAGFSCKKNIKIYWNLLQGQKLTKKSVLAEYNYTII